MGIVERQNSTGRPQTSKQIAEHIRQPYVRSLKYPKEECLMWNNV
jgi:hypothetical protein